MTLPPVTLVVAAAENGVIGINGRLPWQIPADLQRFKALTLGKPCIMGRKTWDSLPRKPLAGRTNIVVTRNPEFCAPGALIASSFERAIEIATRENPPEIAVIGGENIFGAALPMAQRIYLTEVSASPDGDAFMPKISLAEWRVTSRDSPREAGALRYSFVTLERVRPSP